MLVIEPLVLNLLSLQVLKHLLNLAEQVEVVLVLLKVDAAKMNGIRTFNLQIVDQRHNYFFEHFLANRYIFKFLHRFPLLLQSMQI